MFTDTLSEESCDEFIQVSKIHYDSYFLMLLYTKDHGDLFHVTFAQLPDFLLAKLLQ